jgi:phospholipid/cholesterol/gamma-HCH transport system ATP-binding protein
MTDTSLVLELAGVGLDPAAGRLPSGPFSLQLASGDCVLIECRDPGRAAEFSDLCCGFVMAQQGSVRFLGRDWSQLTSLQAFALRGRIGRVYGTGAWISFLGMDLNILLPQLHHTHRSGTVLREAAAELSRRLGMPGLPLSLPETLSESDRTRAACVRALLGQPRLLLLESPVQARYADLVPPLLNMLAEARDRGAAVIWLTRSDFVWNNKSFPATARLRLVERGLLSHRLAA